MSLEWARHCVRQSKLIPESSFGNFHNFIFWQAKKHKCLLFFLLIKVCELSHQLLAKHSV